MSTDQQRAWFLAATQSHAERVAKAHLGRQGITTYLPMRASKSKRSDVAKSTPLFPGYLFVQIDREQPRWSDVCTTQGVAGLVKVAGAVARVPDWFVDRLHSRELFGLVSLDPPKPKGQVSGFQTGQKLKLTSGAFNGCEVIFERDIVDLRRIQVLISMCGRETAMELPMSDAKAA